MGIDTHTAGVELDDLSALIESVAGVDAQVIPLFASKNIKEGVELRGSVAAQNGLPSKVKVMEHQYCLAFGLTDFKLQGRTLPKLVLSISLRKKPPWNTLASFYVFISRVRWASSLRLLQHDQEALDKVAKLKHDDYLRAWERGYDGDGRWSDALATHAWKAHKVARQAAVQARALADKEKAREKQRAREVTRRNEQEAARAAKAAAKVQGREQQSTAAALPSRRKRKGGDELQRTEQILRDLGLDVPPPAKRVRVESTDEGSTSASAMAIIWRPHACGTQCGHQCGHQCGPARRAVPASAGKRRALPALPDSTAGSSHQHELLPPGRRP